jgi:hypothetical protein
MSLRDLGLAAEERKVNSYHGPPLRRPGDLDKAGVGEHIGGFRHRARRTTFAVLAPRSADNPRSRWHHGTVQVRALPSHEAQYAGWDGSIWLTHALTPPPTWTASARPAPCTMARTSAERTPVLQ